MTSRLLWLLAAVLLAGGTYLLTQSGQHTPETANPSSDGVTMVDVTLPAEFTEQQSLGKQAFEGNCATCHGENAGGLVGKGPPLIHKIYEPSHHGDGAFLMAARQGVRAHHWKFGDMPPVEGLTNSDIENIVAYVRAVQRDNGIN